jgi:tetratricopeptide (TPR) repeat protein
MIRVVPGMIGYIAVLGVALCGVLLPGIATHAAEKAAIENAQVAKLYGEAKKLAERKQLGEAVTTIKKAQAVPEQSAYSEFKLNEYLAYLLTQQKKYAEAAAVFEQLVSSKQATPASRSEHLRTAAQLYYQAQVYPRAAATARQALTQRVGDAALLEILGQAEFLAGDYKNATATLRKLVATAEKERKQPKESWLQTLLSIYDKQQDAANTSTVLTQLLRYYPKPDYWRSVLSTRFGGKYPPAVELGYRRLMLDLGMLKRPSDFEDLALGAIDAGAPGEAVRLLQTGLEQKILAGRDEARFQRMLTFAKEETTKRRAQLGEMARNAQSASTGELSMALGRAYFGEGRYTEAAEAFSQGLKKGGISNLEQGQIDLGIALLRNRQTEPARKAFMAVAEKSRWRDLAELWSLR